ncbi:peptidase S8 and S53 subtilisin kexin sedolisin, partial [Micromonospora zhanjiangensis]
MYWVSRALLALTVIVTVGMTGTPAEAGAESYVKYYRVTARYEGASENLTAIAVRFLGSGERSGDIYDLNAGRRQPDGATLTDPAKLHAGWLLVMPWDAAGPGIQYGALPTDAPAPPPAKNETPPGRTGGPPTAGPTGAPT